MSENTWDVDGGGNGEERRLTAPHTAAIAQSDVMAQLDAAHRYPRSIARFMREAISLATMNEDIAAACMYTLPRDGKKITGPSVRLAEIVASAYGNIQVGGRVLDVEESFLIAEGVVWDVEKNVRATQHVKRRITKRDGKRYGDDMIGTTAAAAISIAIRNAVFRVVPRAYVDAVYAKAREVAVGNATTLAAKREKLLHRLGLLGVTQDRILAVVDATGVEDIGLEQLETLIGLGTAIKDGGMSIDEAFPPLVAPDNGDPKPTDGRRMRVRGKAKDAEPEQPPPPDDGDPSPEDIAAIEGEA